jgi:hypothetical protein
MSAGPGPFRPAGPGAPTRCPPQGPTQGPLGCRAGCAACCIAPSIWSPIPGMPQGKPPGVPCVQLAADSSCRLFGSPLRPPFCGSLAPSLEMCGADRESALAYLDRLERATAPG